MHTLHAVYFDQYALGLLTQFILVLLILFYLLRTMTDSDLIRPSLFFFATLAVYVGVELTAATAVWDRQFYALQLRNAAVYVCILAFIHRTYQFPAIPDEVFVQSTQKEHKIVVAICAFACIVVTGWAVYQCFQLKPDGNPNTNTQLMDFGVAVGMLWMFFVLLRRERFLARQNGSRRWGWQHLPAAQQRPARTLYRFIGISIFTIFLSASMALTPFGFPPPWWREIVPTAGLLVVIFLLATYNFNASLERSSLLGRIVGAMLLVVFLILGLTGLVIARVYSDDINVRPATLTPQTVRFTPQPSAGYWASTLPPQQEPDWGTQATTPQVTLPFAFPFPCCDQRDTANQTRTRIALNEFGVIGFGDWSETRFAYNYQPAIVAYKSDRDTDGPVFVNAGADRATITWPRNTDGVEIAVQVVLYADGRFDLNYPQLTSTDLVRIGFQSGTGGTDFTPFDPKRVYENSLVAPDGLLTDYAILHQQSQHRLMIPLVALVLIASVLSIVGYPLLFRVVLMRPLNALVQGVRKVDAGILDVEVPVFYNDEIGAITQTFNQMVRSVQSVEQRLVFEVEKRTQELSESQRQLGAMEERERIGRDIHDDLGQVMGYMHVQVAAALARMQQNKDDQAQTILKEVDQVALEAHDRVRQYILGIRTEGKATRAGDFWATLDEYLAVARQRYGLTIELTAEAAQRANIRLTPPVETQLLHIIQEGLSNAFKHAEATLVQLYLTAEEGMLTLLLKDNGRGFITSPENGQENGPKNGEENARENTPDDTHFGLKIMQERAQSVNGDLQITSSPGQGTQLRVQVPCALAAPVEAAGDVSYPTWRVMLVDDHALFREGLGNMLRPYGIQIAGEADNGKDAEAQVAVLQPDIILMDLHMPEQDGLETTRRIKARYPHIKIVMLTMANDEALLLQALKAGVSGYLLKSLPTPQFLSLLRDVMAGKTIIAPELAAQALTALARQDSPARPDLDDSLLITELTERQREVLDCVAEGMSNKTIAEALHISESTVKYHINQVLERLHLKTRHELIRYHTYAANTPQAAPRGKD